MAALVFVGVVKMQQTGCVEGTGQDYVRLESPTGVVELHPAFDTTKTILPEGQAASITADTAALSGVFELTYSNLTIQVINIGVTYSDVIASSGANTVVIHVPRATPLAWQVGNKLNVGVVRA